MTGDYVSELRSLVGNLPLILPGSSVALWQGSRLLMVRRAEDATLGLPGGNMEPGESFETCAIRECREELGLRLSVNRLTPIALLSGTDALMHTYANGDVVHNVTALFTYKLQSGELEDIQLSDELTAVEMIDPLFLEKDKVYESEWCCIEAIRSSETVMLTEFEENRGV